MEWVSFGLLCNGFPRSHCLFCKQREHNNASSISTQLVFDSDERYLPGRLCVSRDYYRTGDRDALNLLRQEYVEDAVPIAIIGTCDLVHVINS